MRDQALDGFDRGMGEVRRYIQVQISNKSFVLEEAITWSQAGGVNEAGDEFNMILTELSTQM